MRLSITTLLKPWYRALNLPRKSPKQWHLDRLRDEKQELLEARGPIDRLSEQSDVFFTIARANHDGFRIAEQPALTGSLRHALVYAYMLGKFTSRCAFYQTAAMLCRAERWKEVREVINPRKESKVRIVAGRFDIDPDQFERVCRRLRWVWVLFP